jgi:CubicO group peptidase (beta-lactamase class C family)
MLIDGSCDTRFTEVRSELERNLAERGEVGAAVCVTFRGETVVDLWGGTADPATGQPWDRDTLALAWSCTKGAVALCAHILASRGVIGLDTPVSAYWPEFAKHGKEAVTVRQALGHQSGLAALTEPLPEGAFLDWDTIVDALARQEPLWAPGTRHGYHGLTFGHLIGEVVRRATDRSLGTFFRQEVAEPLGLDFWIGLPEEHDHRVAPNIPADMPGPGDPVASFYLAAMTDPTSVGAAMLGNSGGLMLDPSQFNTRAVRGAEIPALNGVANARALAGMYRPLALGGEADGVRLVDEGQIMAMSSVLSAGLDASVLVPSRWSAGFMKAVDNRHLPAGDSHNGSNLLSEAAFGHAGMGGSLGFADPEAGLSFGYVMNRQGSGLAVNERGQALVDATYRALGYRQPAGGGSWYR